MDLSANRQFASLDALGRSAMIDRIARAAAAPDSRLRAVLLNDLGRQTGDLRLLREAEPLKREALAGCREVLGTLLGFGVLTQTNAALVAGGTGLGCLCPPLGAVAVLLFCLPTAPASQPRAVCL